MITIDKCRQTLLEVVKRAHDRSKNPVHRSDLNSYAIFAEVSKILGFQNNRMYEQMTMSAFQMLINTGHIAWGLDFINPNPPCFHVTDQGIKSLENLSRDPSNPIEYKRYVVKFLNLSDIEMSYFDEAISTFNSGHYKSAAVMIGATAECLIFKIRDLLITKISNRPKALTDWKAKTVFKALKTFLDKHETMMSKELNDEYIAYWPALNEQLRRTRNDAGHPENISSFTFEDVHASLLMFPNITKLTNNLLNFIQNSTFP